MSLYFDNNKLFDAEGHLTDEGLYAIKDGTLDDLGALEAAEHLSFCDYCLLRYTAMIDAAPDCMKQPMRDLIPQVQSPDAAAQLPHYDKPLCFCRRRGGAGVCAVGCNQHDCGVPDAAALATAAARRPAGALRHQIYHRRQRLLQESGRYL